jgi:hypothetical protein
MQYARKHQWTYARLHGITFQKGRHSSLFITSNVLDTDFYQYIPYRISAKYSDLGEILSKGARGSVVVKALCYKPVGHGSDSR